MMAGAQRTRVRHSCLRHMPTIFVDGDSRVTRYSPPPAICHEDGCLMMRKSEWRDAIMQHAAAALCLLPQAHAPHVCFLHAGCQAMPHHVTRAILDARRAAVFVSPPPLFSSRHDSRWRRQYAAMACFRRLFATRSASAARFAEHILLQPAHSVFAHPV